MLKKTFLLGFLLSLFVPFTAHAAELIYKEDSYTVSADTRLEDNLIITVDSLYVDGVIEGDLIVAANTVEISGEVTGDVIAVGNYITIKESAKIGKNLRLVGTMIDMDGDIAEGAFILGSQITSKAAIHGDMQVSGSNMELGNAVDGNVRIDTTMMSFLEGTQIGGNLEHSNAASTDFSQVTVAGEIIKITGDVSFYDQLLIDISNAFTHLVISFMFGLLLLLLFPLLLYKTASLYQEKLGMHLIKGIGFSVIGIVIGFILIIGIFTIPIGLTLITITTLMLYMGHIIFSFWLGLKATRLKNDPKNKYSQSLLILLVGLTLYSVGQLIPIFNIFLSFWATATGAGVLMQYLWHARKATLSEA